MVDEVNEDYTHMVETIVKQRISSSTRALLEKQRHMDRQAYQVEYAILSRLCRQRLAEGHANFVRNRLLDAAHSKRSLKVEKRALAEHCLSIPCMKAPDGSRCTSRLGMENIMVNFYSAFFRSSLSQTTNVLSSGEEVPPFLPSEVRHAIEEMPRGKAPIADGIVVEPLQTHAVHRTGKTVFPLPCEVRSTSSLEADLDHSSSQKGRQRRLGELPPYHATVNVIQGSHALPPDAQLVNAGRSSTGRTGRIPVQHTGSHNHLLSIDRSRPRIPRTASADICRLQKDIRFSGAGQGLENAIKNRVLRCGTRGF
ncbi:hypothetical protein ANCDUO_00916 [Ancylostoma duodenale]|uniref:Uncharacterized protein n=1 Tax=Ancylostoma duodenale TaxID=51022 RepID=A0A0C2HGJ4_9BILA|nr:hypothetical protein ANCDUO_00916 [Ancylostoma duodenale]